MNKLDTLRHPLSGAIKDATHEFVETHLEPFGLKDESELSGVIYANSPERARRQKKLAQGLIVCGFGVGELLSVSLVAANNVISRQDRGPLYYSQQRIQGMNEVSLDGYDQDNNPIFTSVHPNDTPSTIDTKKVRTMKNDVDVKHTTVGNKIHTDSPDVILAGKILRKKPFNFLDEGPQLRKVISGELAVVGPRPNTLVESTSSSIFEACDNEIDCFNEVNKIARSIRAGIIGPYILADQREVTDDPEDSIKRFGALISQYLYCSPELDTHFTLESIRALTPGVTPKYVKRQNNINTPSFDLAA